MIDRYDILDALMGLLDALGEQYAGESAAREALDEVRRWALDQHVEVESDNYIL